MEGHQAFFVEVADDAGGSGSALPHLYASCASLRILSASCLLLRPLAMGNSTAAVELTTLLASQTATLVYAIPLLIASLVLTFAGTFLTLDRSRSFPPKHDKTDKFIYSSYESFEKRRSMLWWWRLEGGVGGLAEGYVFGGEFCLHRTSRQRRTRI